MCACRYMLLGQQHTLLGVHGGQKEVSDPWGLELEVVVGLLKSVLRTKLRSRTANIQECSAISPIPVGAFPKTPQLSKNRLSMGDRL